MAVTDKREFKKKVTSSVRAVQRNPSKVASFFHKDSLKYAA